MAIDSRLQSIMTPRYEGMPSVAEAWISWNIEIDPSKLELDTRWLKEYRSLIYKHNFLGDIHLERDSTWWFAGDIKHTKFHGPGYNSKRFLAFENGYNREGNRPSVWRPILRHYFNVGTDANCRREWPEKDRPLLDMVRGEERFWSEGFMNLSETPVKIINRKTGEVVREYVEPGEYYDRR